MASEHRERRGLSKVAAGHREATLEERPYWAWCSAASEVRADPLYRTGHLAGWEQEPVMGGSRILITVRVHLRNGEVRMIDQALIALAECGGNAVVTAAGTDAWAELRRAVARWFGRGEAQREQAELDRLDQTTAELQAADLAEVEQARIRQEASWQARIEAVLESLTDAERGQAAEELQSLLEQHAPGSVSAGRGGLAVGGNAGIRADRGSIAAGVIHGGAHIGSPPPGPDPSQG
ncbi:hypothetical protein [Streptomyces sp. NPDC001165]|uniref:hypothetical protein n=1 Tax=Streptomyces sp. NPDC001165 TaxID=3364546 RepID=UPI0036AA61D3